MLVCLPLAAPIGLSPLRVLTLRGSECGVVVATSHSTDSPSTQATRSGPHYPQSQAGSNAAGPPMGTPRATPPCPAAPTTTAAGDAVWRGRGGGGCIRSRATTSRRGSVQARDHHTPGGKVPSNRKSRAPRTPPTEEARGTPLTAGLGRVRSQRLTGGSWRVTGGSWQWSE